MAIKNYSTKVPVSRTVGEIQELLAKHGANRVSVDYGEGGRVLGVVFSLADAHGCNVYRLPARADAVKKVLEHQKVKCTDEQAERVAWRNVKDWIDAQIALVETGQAEASEVLMPYMLDKEGRTLFQALNHRALEGGDA